MVERMISQVRPKQMCAFAMLMASAVFLTSCGMIQQSNQSHVAYQKANFGSEAQWIAACEASAMKSLKDAEQSHLSLLREKHQVSRKATSGVSPARPSRFLIDHQTILSEWLNEEIQAQHKALEQGSPAGRTRLAPRIAKLEKQHRANQALLESLRQSAS